MIRVCAWCEKEMGVKCPWCAGIHVVTVGPDSLCLSCRSVFEKSLGGVTHGICEICAKKKLAARSENLAPSGRFKD